jgi:hypothetical protein
MQSLHLQLSAIQSFIHCLLKAAGNLNSEIKYFARREGFNLFGQFLPESDKHLISNSFKCQYLYRF